MTDAPAVEVRVLAFARLRELLGFGERRVAVAAAATLDDVWSAVTAGQPEAARLRASTRFACNGVVADGTTRVGPGDEIALLPPVGGG
jgi:molybdopterin synthase catalytic subunit/molybdopterin synthase sulfur carrier subunit